MGDMEDKVSEDTFEHTIDGRVVVFKKMPETRTMLLNRMIDAAAKRAEQARLAGDAEERSRQHDRINDLYWTTVEAQFTDPADLEFVQMGILHGRIETKDITPLLSNGVTAPADDDTPPAPKPPRKRAPKVPVKRGSR